MIEIFKNIIKNRFALIAILFLSATWFTSCEKENEEEKIVGIEGITFENYPKMDGSTSARALNQMIACKLLGVRYEWSQPTIELAFVEWQLHPNSEDIPAQYQDFFWQRIKTSQTHGAFMNLIDGEADIILTHRTISPDEKAYAVTKGITLIETSIALDAFVFVVHKSNPVKSLTVSQIQKIYTGEITNWSQVGGKNEEIDVFTRPRNSGSEEVFRELVMGDLEPVEFPALPIGDMSWVFREISGSEKGICYTFNNYKEMILRIPDTEVPKIAVNGISANETTVRNRTFPFISEVHVAIRSDLNHNTMAYKLYEWLQTDDSHSVIKDCGFVLR